MMEDQNQKDQNPYSQNGSYQDYAGQGQNQNYENNQYQGNYQGYGNGQNYGNGQGYGNNQGYGNDQGYGNNQGYGNDQGYGNYQYQGQQNPYYQNSEPKKSANTISIVGMIFGIISIPVSCCIFYNLIFCIPGLICSIMGYKQTRSGIALAGIICSVIGGMITLIMIILYFIGLGILRSGYFYNYFY